MKLKIFASVLAPMAILPVFVLAQGTPTITSVESAGNPAGEIDSEKIATIYGSGLSGEMTIKIGSQEIQTLSVSNSSDSSLSFTVPTRQSYAYVSISVTNSSGETSNYYTVKINVPTTEPASPVVTQPPPTPAPAPTPVENAYLAYIQVPAEDVNIIRTGERARIYGSGIRSHKIILESGSHKKEETLTKIYSTYEFIVPNVPSGTYYAWLEAPGEQPSNKISVRLTNSLLFPVPKLEVTPTSVGFTYTPTFLSSEEKEIKIKEIQSLLMQLIAQLIQLLQQQSASTSN